MSKQILKRPLALATASLLAIASADAAVVVNEQFEGGWWNPTQDGRGVLADYIPVDDSHGTLFLAIFSFDNAGKPIWLTAQVELSDREFKKTGVPVGLRDGGGFGNDFPPTTIAQVGTLDFTALSCSRIKLDFTPNGATTLPPVNLDLQPVGSVPAGCAYIEEFSGCPAGTTAVAGLERACALPATISSDLHLSNAATYVINGKVQVGTGRNTGAATLSIEPGTRLQGGGGAVDYLVVQPGSKIFSNGAPSAPVVFTGPSDVPGDWAGLVIAGNAIDNSCTGNTPCAFEADTDVKYGGKDSPQLGGNLIPDNADSSGALRYTQVRFAGKEIRPSEELNSITLLGVGSGTVIDHVQVHAGKDDGFEMFGGTVNLRYVIGTAIEDDCLDFANGYTGKVQYAFCQQTATAGNGSHGFEWDNKEGAFDLLPRTQPKLSNVTLIQASSGDEAIRIRRGAGGNLFNVVATNAPTECLNFNDAATFNASGNAANPTATGVLTMRGSALGCNNNFEDSASDPFLVSAWYTSQPGNFSGAPAALGLDGRFPSAGSILLGTGVPVPNDSFFDTTDYKGAFSSKANDWARGWSFKVQ
ncbi:MAG: hypothetical protein AB7V26_01525 [Lysobacterales bacterium]